MGMAKCTKSIESSLKRSRRLHIRRSCPRLLGRKGCKLRANDGEGGRRGCRDIFRLGNGQQ